MKKLQIINEEVIAKVDKESHVPFDKLYNLGPINVMQEKMPIKYIYEVFKPLEKNFSGSMSDLEIELGVIEALFSYCNPEDKEVTPTNVAAFMHMFSTRVGIFQDVDTYTQGAHHILMNITTFVGCTNALGGVPVRLLTEERVVRFLGEEFVRTMVTDFEMITEYDDLEDTTFSSLMIKIFQDRKNDNEVQRLLKNIGISPN